MDDRATAAFLNRAFKGEDEIFGFLFKFDFTVAHNAEGRVVVDFIFLVKDLVDLADDQFFNQDIARIIRQLDEAF